MAFFKPRTGEKGSKSDFMKPKTGEKGKFKASLKKFMTKPSEEEHKHHGEKAKAAVKRFASPKAPHEKSERLKKFATVRKHKED